MGDVLRFKNKFNQPLSRVQWNKIHTYLKPVETVDPSLALDIVNYIKTGEPVNFINILSSARGQEIELKQEDLKDINLLFASMHGNLDFLRRSLKIFSVLRISYEMRLLFSNQLSNQNIVKDGKIPYWYTGFLSSLNTIKSTTNFEIFFPIHKLIYLLDVDDVTPENFVSDYVSKQPSSFQYIFLFPGVFESLSEKNKKKYLFNGVLGDHFIKFLKNKKTNSKNYLHEISTLGITSNRRSVLSYSQNFIKLHQHESFKYIVQHIKKGQQENDTKKLLLALSRLDKSVSYSFLESIENDSHYEKFHSIIRNELIAIRNNLDSNKKPITLDELSHLDKELEHNIHVWIKEAYQRSIEVLENELSRLSNEHEKKGDSWIKSSLKTHMQTLDRKKLLSVDDCYESLLGFLKGGELNEKNHEELSWLFNRNTYVLTFDVVSQMSFQHTIRLLYAHHHSGSENFNLLNGYAGKVIDYALENKNISNKFAYIYDEVLRSKLYSEAAVAKSLFDKAGYWWAGDDNYLKTKEYLLDKDSVMETVLEVYGDSNISYLNPDALIWAYKILYDRSNISYLFLEKAWDHALLHKQDLVTKGAKKVVSKYAKTYTIAYEIIADQKKYKTAAERKIIKNKKIAAIKWMGEIHNQEAIPYLKQILMQKDDKLIQITALNALKKIGVEIHSLMSKEKFLKEAWLMLKSGLPKELQWFDFSSMPKLYWKSDGKEVAIEVIKSTFIMTLKTKKISENVELELFRDFVKDINIDKYSEYILDSWIKYDGRGLDLDVMAEKLKEELFIMREENADKNVDWSNLTQCIKTRLFNDCYKEEQSIKSLPILSTLIYFNSSKCAENIIKYAELFRGYRANKTKSLVATLAYFESDNAISYLGESAAFHTYSGLMKTAKEVLEAKALRNRWPLFKLNDHILPKCGFIYDAAKGLSYLKLRQEGNVLEARIDTELKLKVFNASGEELKKIPAYTGGDKNTKEHIKAYKSNINQFKKTLAFLKKRFFDEMCLGVKRSHDEFHTLYSNPIAQHVMKRIIWKLNFEKKSIVAIKAIDGFYDSQNSMVAEQGLVDIEVLFGSGANRSYADFAKKLINEKVVSTLFDQFLDANEQPHVSRDGYSIDLRIVKFSGGKSFDNLMKKYNFTRGQAIDGPEFYHYEREFIEHGIKVQIQFSGNDVSPAENDIVIESVSFLEKIKDDFLERVDFHIMKLNTVPSSLKIAMMNILKNAN